MDEPRSAVARSPALAGDHLQVGERRSALTEDVIRGEITHEFGTETLSFSGWAAGSKPDDPLTVHFFADGEHVHSVECDPAAGDATGSAGFSASIPLEALEPAEREVTAVAESGSGEAGYLPVGGGPVIPSLPLRERSDFTTVVQSPVSRVRDAGQLAYLARWGLGRFQPGMGHYAAAICVLGYRIVENRDRFGRFTGEAWTAIERWNEEVGDPPDGATTRWHISLNTVGGYLALMEEDLDRAAAQFGKVADLYGDIARAPISAHNVSICTFMAGWLSYKAGDRERALAYFRRVLVVVRTGLQVQPIDTNFYVWNECARMSYLGQQAVWMLGYLDPDFAKKARWPDDPSRFTLKPVLIRVPQLFKDLPEELASL